MVQAATTTTSRDISPAQGALITAQAALWKGTPYASAFFFPSLAPRMFRYQKRLSACVALLTLVPLLLGQTAKAEDETAAVVPSGLHAVPAGSVTITNSAIALQGGTLSLSLTTRAQTAAMINLAFPAFKWQGEQDSYPDRQFPELQINIDHSPALVQDHSKAIFAGTNITSDLQAAGIDIFTISQSPPVLFATPANQNLFNQLVATGAIAQPGGQDIAAWSAQRALSFGLPQGVHVITITYHVRPAITLLPVAQLPKALPLASYCLSPAILHRAALKAAKGGYVLATQYIIPAGINGNTGGPVAINLIPPGVSSTTFFCAPNGKRVTVTTATQNTLAKPETSGTVHILTLGGAVAN